MSDKIAEVVPVLYLDTLAATKAGLHASDIVHPTFHSKYVMLDNKKAIMDLRGIQEEMKAKRQAYRDNNRPIVSIAPDGQTPTVLLADEHTEAEEVQDLLGQAYEKNEERLRKNRPNFTRQSQVMDTDWIRHVNGIYPADQFDTKFREAIGDKMEQHRRDPITNPARDPWAYAREQGQIPPQISVPATPWKEDEA